MKGKNQTVTRKDYELIAKVLRDARERHCDETTLTHVAGKLGEAMQRDNSRFNYSRFLGACGLPGYGGK